MAYQGPSNLEVKYKGTGFGTQLNWGKSTVFPNVNSTLMSAQANTNLLYYVTRQYGLSYLDNILCAYDIGIVDYYANNYADVVDVYCFDHTHEDKTTQYIDTWLVKQVLNKYDYTADVAYNSGTGADIFFTA